MNNPNQLVAQLQSAVQDATLRLQRSARLAQDKAMAHTIWMASNHTKMMEDAANEAIAAGTVFYRDLDALHSAQAKLWQQTL